MTDTTMLKAGARRFYTLASARPDGDGHVITLDDRLVRTPHKAALSVPTIELADAIAMEWNAQGEKIDPASMILTKLANTAIDRVASRTHEIIAEIVHFSASDLLCYRAANPDSLVAAQSRAWNPVVSWFADQKGVAMRVVEGVVHVEQPGEALAGIEADLAVFEPFALTAIHNVTTLTSSALLAIAEAHGFLSGGEIWSAAHVDEDWQISQWGEDQEASERRALRLLEFDAACRFRVLSQQA